ncbi:MAG: hypothetical protein SF051_07780 [Elusimicrobiota bacterium]|nr:hypothetical protein [Elusimicrobiota bacterium]
MTASRFAAPLAYAALGAALLWAAHGRAFVREDALQIPSHCSRLTSAPVSSLLLSRAVGEDGAYYRPLANLFLGLLARAAGCGDARPYRAAAGLLWLLCAAALALALLEAGASPPAAWGGAALLLVHPYNSWFFVSPLLATGALLLPASYGAWRGVRAAEGGRAAGIVAAAACVYVACLARESAVALPFGLALAVFALRPRPTRATLAALLAAFAAAGLYLLQRRLVLAHDPPPFPTVWRWSLLPQAAVAATEYLRVAVTGSFRVYGGMVPSGAAAPHAAAWAAAAAFAVYAARSRREALAWTGLLLVCASELAVATLLNGEVLPVRAVGTYAFLLFLLLRAAPGLPERPRLVLSGALLAAGAWWTTTSLGHARASLDPDAFLERHSHPPYSWKFEAERAASWLRRGDPDRALTAARDSERLRPSWLTKVLRASIEALRAPSGRLDELRVLAASGRGEPGASFGYLNLGVAFGRNGAWSEADDCLRLASELAPDSARPWSQRAWAATSRGRWDEGAAFAAKALALDPGDLDARQNLAFSLLWLRRWEESAAAYRALNAASPALPAAKLFWAHAEASAGRPERAWELLLTSAADPHAAAYLSRLAARLGRPAPAPVDPRVASALDAALPR